MSERIIRIREVMELNKNLIKSWTIEKSKIDNKIRQFLDMNFALLDELEVELKAKIEEATK